MSRPTKLYSRYQLIQKRRDAQVEKNLHPQTERKTNVNHIKIEKARRKSSIGSGPMTWRVHLDAVPPSVVARLTSTELAELIDAMRGLTEATKAFHEREIVDEGAIWDARRQRLREIA